MIVTFGTRAKRDLGSIWDYIAQEDSAAADRVIERIYGASRRLADFPESGPTRHDIAHGVRSLSVGSYLVLYRVMEQVEVVRVIHSARDLPAAMREVD